MSERKKKGERISLGDSSAVPVDAVIGEHLRVGFPLNGHRHEVVEAHVRFMGSVAESDLQSAEDCSSADLNNALWVSGEYRTPVIKRDDDAEDSLLEDHEEALEGFHQSELSEEEEENARFEQETAVLLKQCTHRG